MPATTAAQAPVPQASVSPAPRSNTRKRIERRPMICMKPALTRCGKRMVLDQRSLACYRRKIDVVDDLDRVRIAHRHGGDCHFGAVYVEGLHKRGRIADKGDFRRSEFRHTHIDGDVLVVLQAQRDHALHRFDPNLALPGQPPLMREADETARAVAALLDLTAVGVENPVAEIDIGAIRLFDEQNLIAAHAEMPVAEMAQLFCIEGDRLANAVDHDEVVPQPLHFREFDAHCLPPCQFGIRTL